MENAGLAAKRSGPLQAEISYQRGRSSFDDRLSLIQKLIVLVFKYWDSSKTMTGV